MNITRTRIGVRTCLLPVLRADSRSGGAAPTLSTVGFPDSTEREAATGYADIRMRAWSSRSTTLSHLVPLREHFKGWRAMETTYRSAELYTETRLKAKKANATVNRELELLRRALRLAKDRGLLLSLPKISLLPEHNTRQGFSTHMSLNQSLNQPTIKPQGSIPGPEGRIFTPCHHAGLGPGSCGLPPGRDRRAAPSSP
jgi:hypothetical protein